MSIKYREPFWTLRQRQHEILSGLRVALWVLVAMALIRFIVWGA